tara:strand:+ start:213 stop:419 length:207 start_codon:yes stop_codon:yes gene_type:complete
MKLFLNILLIIFISDLSLNTAYSLSDFQIKEICKKKKKSKNCIKNMKLKKYNLFQGNRIEIPVIPFKK